MNTSNPAFGVWSHDEDDSNEGQFCRSAHEDRILDKIDEERRRSKEAPAQPATGKGTPCHDTEGCSTFESGECKGAYCLGGE